MKYFFSVLTCSHSPHEKTAPLRTKCYGSAERKTHRSLTSDLLHTVARPLLCFMCWSQSGSLGLWACWGSGLSFFLWWLRPSHSTWISCSSKTWLNQLHPVNTHSSCEEESKIILHLNTISTEEVVNFDSKPHPHSNVV